MLKSEGRELQQQCAHILEQNFLQLSLQLIKIAAARLAAALLACSVQSEVLAQVWPPQPVSSVLYRCVTSV